MTLRQSGIKVNVNSNFDLYRTFLRMKNGARGSIWVSSAATGGVNGFKIRVYGNKGSVEISGFSMDEIKHWDFYKNYKKPITKAHKHIYGIGHIQLYGEICKAIKGRKNIAPTVKDGYENVKLIEKIYQSVK